MSSGGLVEDIGAVSASATEPSATPTVLVVDDSQTAARAMARTLERVGYRTAVFHTGNGALRYVQRCQTPGATTGEEERDDSDRPLPADCPAAALVDIHLPDIHGLIVSAKLREALGPNAPIIIVSGDTSMANLNALPHVGATYFFSKPITATQLLEQLRRTLRPAGE